MSDNAPRHTGTQPDLATRKHVFTFFDDRYAFVKFEDALTLPEIADEIAAMCDRSKAKLPWLKMARFGDTPSSKRSLRTNANLKYISGVEIDYDAGEMSFDEARRRLHEAGVRCLIYTSASHTPERPRWRVLAPTSALLEPARRVELVATINGVLGGVVANESFVLSTAFYYGYVTGKPHHRVEVVDGRLIDQCEDLWAGRVYKKGRDAKPEAAPAAPGAAQGYTGDDITELLRTCRERTPANEGQWHHNMLTVVASLVNKGKSDTEIYDLTAPFCDAGWGDPDIKLMITGTRAKWRIPDPGTTPDLADSLGPLIAQAQEESGHTEELPPPAWREQTKGGIPKASLHNARVAIEHSGILCSEDVFHHTIWIGRNPATAPAEALPRFVGRVDDSTIRSLRFFLSDRYGIDLTEAYVREAVLELARERQFNPVTEMLADAEANWDGVRRLDRLAADYFNCEDTAVNAACARKTIVAAVARARRPGIKFDTILVLEGPEGFNKSSAWAVLAGEGNFSDERIIGQATREVQEQLQGVWIHENADLAGLRKAEVETVKAFASRQVDRARPAYGRMLVEQPRQSIEVGTTNDSEYLQSQTGNRRFWPMTITRPIDLDRLRRHRLQLWGEAAHYQSQGEGLVLDEALWADAAIEQEARRVRDPWEEKLASLRAVTVNVPGVGDTGNGIVHLVEGEERVATSVIFEHVLRLNAGQLHDGHAKRLARTMQALGWDRKQFRMDGEVVRGYTRKKK